MSVTIERLQSQILRELSILLQREIKNTKIGYVTVTEVRLTNDLSYAYVYYTVLGNKDRIEVTQEALERSEGFIKSEIAKKVKMRKIPEYIFKYDDSLDRGKRIDELLEEIKKQINLWHNVKVMPIFLKKSKKMNFIINK